MTEIDPAIVERAFNAWCDTADVDEWRVRNTLEAAPMADLMENAYSKVTIRRHQMGAHSLVGKRVRLLAVEE